MCNCTTACEKPVVEENGNNGEEVKNSDMVRITFNNISTDQSSFGEDAASTASRVNEQRPIAELCTRISIGIFDMGSGEKVTAINQDQSNASFGKVTVSIAKGKYAIVAIAHSGEGNATISSPSKITFKDNKVTDTFYYYGNIDAESDGNYNMNMKRAVAMFRLIVKDQTPASIRTMKFYYTGGSSTLDATTGFGCVNSKQTEFRAVLNSAYSSESSYDIYTFPHEDGRKLKIDVSALENATATKATYTKTFADVSMTRNKISRNFGYFYGEDPGNGRSFDITTTDEWEYDDHEY